MHFNVKYHGIALTACVLCTLGFNSQSCQSSKQFTLIKWLADSGDPAAKKIIQIESFLPGTPAVMDLRCKVGENKLEYSIFLFATQTCTKYILRTLRDEKYLLDQAQGCIF